MPEFSGNQSSLGGCYRFTALVSEDVVLMFLFPFQSLCSTLIRWTKSQASRTDPVSSMEPVSSTQQVLSKYPTELNVRAGTQGMEQAQLSCLAMLLTVLQLVGTQSPPLDQESQVDPSYLTITKLFLAPNTVDKASKANMAKSED